ncbi:MAG: hypothetical protein JWM95_1820 [Gemmatimonadetes bacterium]|nr:hypothetical protein [Gemmatimonadota bacterium]
MTPDHRTGIGPLTNTAASRQERLRFHEFSVQRTPAGRVSCQVMLEYGTGQLYTGQTVGQASPAGETRLGAEAAIQALQTFTEQMLTFELVGVKVSRAFDANVVIASLVQHRTGGAERLLGCYLTDGDLVRAAAIAVLNATNRVLTEFILTR